MLIKRYRGDQTAESAAKLEQISLAYSILTGRYLEPQAPDPRQDKIILGKSRRQWANIWHYGRLPLLLGLIGAIFIGYVIYTMVTHKDSDFQIAFVGKAALSENYQTKTESLVRNVFPEYSNVDVLTLYMDFDQEGEDLSAAIMKMITLMAGDTIEVYLVDQPVFARYAGQGAFADLTELYTRLQSELPAATLAKIKTLQVIIEDESNEPFICGLDVTGLQLTDDFGIVSDSQILTIGSRSNVPDQAAKLIESIIAAE